MTGIGNWDTYLECRSHHALDCIIKPLKREEILAFADSAFAAA